MQKYEFSRIRESKILERLRKAESALEQDELEQALVEFNKVIFYDKSIPEVYVEKAEIYIKLCDFSSAISCFKKALYFRAPMNQASQDEWTERMNTLFFMKGLAMIEEGYCNDALNLVSQLQSEDVKFRYLNALACIRVGNKDLAFTELEKCIQLDPSNIECYILKGKLLWSIDRLDDGNQCFW